MLKKNEVYSVFSDKNELILRYRIPHTSKIYKKILDGIDLKTDGWSCKFYTNLRNYSLSDTTLITQNKILEIIINQIIHLEKLNKSNKPRIIEIFNFLTENSYITSESSLFYTCIDSFYKFTVESKEFKKFKLDKCEVEKLLVLKNELKSPNVDTIIYFSTLTNCDTYILERYENVLSIDFLKLEILNLENDVSVKLTNLYDSPRKYFNN